MTVRDRRFGRLGSTGSESGGEGCGERLLGRVRRAGPSVGLRIATKISPRNRVWPPPAGTDLGAVFSAECIRESAERSLANIGVARSPRWRAPPCALARRGRAGFCRGSRFPTRSRLRALSES